MVWWNDFLGWIASTEARPSVLMAILVAVAILVSGIIAALIARGAVRGLLARGEHAQRRSAIALLVDASTEAAVWHSLTPGEQVLSDRAVGQADIQIRMLPVSGARAAADWAGYRLAEMKRNSSTFGYQLHPAIAEFRDRLVEWQAKPRRTRRFFAEDLERWRIETTTEEKRLRDDEDGWRSDRHQEQYAAARPAAEPSTSPHPTAAPATLAPPVGNRPIDTDKLMADVDRLDRRRPTEDDHAPEPMAAGADSAGSGT